MPEVPNIFIFCGLFLLTMVLGERLLKRIPVSPAMIYLGVGLLLGPQALGLVHLDIEGHPKIVELVAEIVVILSLFSAGLKLRAPFHDLRWKISVNLATLTMVLNAALVAMTAHFLFGLSWPVGILLGGIMAPTDPVLASEVQVDDEKDTDRIRSGLTGEAGFNDGTAFPLIMLGLMLLGERWQEADLPWLNWFAVDLVWGIGAGLSIGAFTGWLGAKLIIRMHAGKEDELIIEDFVSLGLVALSYGAALAVESYGFLAVFACALAFARMEARYHKKRARPRANEEEGAFSPALLRFSTQLERIGEVGTVFFVGLMAGGLDYSWPYLLFPALLILVFRPAAIFVTFRGRLPRRDYLLFSWFGIRGIGSIYYLSYAMNHGFKTEESSSALNMVLVTIVFSIVLFGLTGSPIMRLYERGKM